VDPPYWDWLRDEVPYIVTNQERVAFKKLTTDDEREMFIESFWKRHNPNPLIPENEYKEEYYQRIVYANEHYGSGIPGWKTDRGRIYIMYGPPDEIESHPSGGAYKRPDSEGGGTSNYPSEQWRYRYIDGIGSNVTLNFSDKDRNGEYRLTMDPGEKEELLHGPWPIPRSYDRSWESPRNNISHDGFPFTRLDLYTKVFQPPAVKFKDLKAVVTSKMSFHLLPFDVRTDFIRATDETVLTPIAIQIANSDLQFQNKVGVMHGVLDIFGEVTSLGGRIVNTFEKTLVLDVPEQDFQQFQNHKLVYQVVIPIRPGRYKLSLVLKDDLNGHMGTEELGIVVPSFSEDKLTYSSLILADRIYPSATNQVGFGPFWIGGTMVHPNFKNTFTRDQRLGIYMQVYNLGIDDKTHKPSLDVTCKVEKDGKLLPDRPVDNADLRNASQQFTVIRSMGLRGLTPGKYTVQIKVTDNIKKQTVSPSATFEVR
jgi:GWxTD domain-containing protein